MWTSPQTSPSSPPHSLPSYSSSGAASLQGTTRRTTSVPMFKGLARCLLKQVDWEACPRHPEWMGWIDGLQVPSGDVLRLISTSTTWAAHSTTVSLQCTGAWGLALSAWVLHEAASSPQRGPDMPVGSGRGNEESQGIGPVPRATPYGLLSLHPKLSRNQPRPVSDSVGPSTPDLVDVRGKTGAVSWAWL